MVVITTMVKLLFAMVAGFILNRKDIIDDKTCAKCSTLIVKFTCLCLQLYSISSVSHDNMAMVFKLFILGVIIYCTIYPISGFIFTRLFRIPKGYRGTYTTMLIFSNAAFMAYPVVQAFIGDQAIFYLTIFNMPFNLIFFTLAVNLYRRDYEITDGDAGEKKKTKVTDILNTGVIVSIACLVIYFANIHLPSMFYECLGFVGNITTPLSMVLIGASMGKVSFKEIIALKRAWFIIPFRLVVVPILVFFAARFFLADYDMVAAVTLCAGMPIASFVGMGTAIYPKQGREAAIAVSLSTLVSFITLPVMAILLGLT